MTDGIIINIYLTMKEAAQYLKISMSKLQKMSATRTLPVYKPTPNGKVYFLKKDLDEYMAAGYRPSAEELKKSNNIIKFQKTIKDEKF